MSADPAIPARTAGAVRRALLVSFEGLSEVELVEDLRLPDRVEVDSLQLVIIDGVLNEELAREFRLGADAVLIDLSRWTEAEAQVDAGQRFTVGSLIAYCRRAVEEALAAG